MLYCKFPGECDSERILKTGQYLTKLCVDYVAYFFGFTLAGPPCRYSAPVPFDVAIIVVTDKIVDELCKWNVDTELVLAACRPCSLATVSLVRSVVCNSKVECCT